MQIKENTKPNRFIEIFNNNFTIIGIMLSVFVFLGSVVLHWVLNKISFDTMFLFHIGAIVMILFFLLIDIQNKLDDIQNKLNNK